MNKRHQSEILRTLSLAIQNQQSGLLDEAERLYEKVLSLAPTNSNALNNLGIILHLKGNDENALLFFDKAIRIDPDNSEYIYNRALALINQNKHDLAIEELIRLVQLKPENDQAFFNLGGLLRKKNSIHDAINCYKQAIKFNQNHYKALNDLGSSYCDLGLHEKALECFQKAIKINPGHTITYCNMGNIFFLTGQVSAAIQCYEEAINTNPFFSKAYNGLGCVFQETGFSDTAQSYFQSSLIISKNQLDVQSNYLLSLNYNPSNKPDFVCKEHKKFGQSLLDFKKKDSFLNDIYHERILKIGYVSPDFRTHSVAYFIEPILLNHNPDKFEIYCYSNVSSPDDTTKRLNSYASKWYDIYGIDDEEVYKYIINDKIDILVDLAGHTGNNKLGVFAKKAAPIQLTYLGYPNTTGLETIDYRLTDYYTDPPDNSKYYSESLLYMPDGFLCYHPPGNIEIASKIPLENNNFITFGSFNSLSKINKQLIEVWAGILKAIPKSRLILKSNAFNDKSTKELYEKYFFSQEISFERLVFKKHVSSLKKHLSYYNNIDICLDTFPYNGTTTSFEALWMGVPVITLKEVSHASRVGYGILSILGLNELIASSKEAYKEKAILLSQNKDRLKYFRNNLRNILSSSALTDSQKFTCNLEKKYKQIWKKYLSST